jgi:hypothetical protein
MSDLWTRKRFPRFSEGEIVALTKEAIRRNIKGRGSIYGVVLRPGWLGRMSVKVRRIDQRTAGDYHVTFWRHTTPAERRRSNDPR